MPTIHFPPGTGRGGGGSLYGEVQLNMLEGSLYGEVCTCRGGGSFMWGYAVPM